MPNLDVTVDIESILGVDLIAVVPRPYNPTGLIPILQGGHYLDCLIFGQSLNFDLIHPHAWEHSVTTPSRLKNAGSGHTILGWARSNAVPVVPDASPRFAVVSFDLGETVGALISSNVSSFRHSGGRAIVCELDTGNMGVGNGTNLHEFVYDALEDHPPGLSQALINRGTNRRQSAMDPPGSQAQRGFNL